MLNQGVASRSLSTSPCLWNFSHLREIWLFGYRSTEVSNFLDSIPIKMWPSLMNVLGLLEKKYVTSRVRTELKAINIRPKELSSFQSEIENEMWEEQKECGYLQLTFDTESGDRSDIAVNDFQAYLWNMTKQELFCRLANFNMPFFVPETDFLQLIVDDILHEFHDRERYYRIYTSFDPPQNAILVHCSVRRRFNACGQCYLVTFRNLSFVLNENK